MKKHFTTILLCSILVAGLSLLLYPSISDYWNMYHQSRSIAKYTEAVDQLGEEEKEQMRKDAEAYNEALKQKPNRWELSKAEYEEYESLLDVSGTGIMGYIEIPNLHVQIPIYHGIDQEILQIAVGHIEGSSLPIGGLGTHSVISGHRGLKSAKLFTDLDQLAEGDIFKLSVLGETLTYQIDQIHIVLPEELNELQIEENKDYCTLLTCTPYGVNTHRLLVRGHRIENEEEAHMIVQDASIVPPLHEATILMVILLACYILLKKILIGVNWEYMFDRFVVKIRSGKHENSEKNKK